MKTGTTKKIIKNPAFEKNKKRYLQYKKCFKDNLPYLTVPKLHEMHTIFAHVIRLSEMRKTQDKIINPLIENIGSLVKKKIIHNENRENKENNTEYPLWKKQKKISKI